jgi:hypothetical protein
MLRAFLLHLCSDSPWLDFSASAWCLSPWRTRHTTPRHGVTRLGIGLGRCWRSARRAAAPLLRSLVAGVCLASSALAAVPYDINQAYVGGSQVSFNGQIYEAKWYANPGQTPGMQVAIAWETPWQAVGNDTEDPDGSVPPPSDGGEALATLTRPSCSAATPWRPRRPP